MLYLPAVKKILALPAWTLLLLAGLAACDGASPDKPEPKEELENKTGGESHDEASPDKPGPEEEPENKNGGESQVGKNNGKNHEDNTNEVLPSEAGVIVGKVSHKSVKRSPTLVYIEEMPGRQFPAPGKAAICDQRNKEFQPAILPVLVGTTVDFLNDDDFDHNVNSPDGETFNLGNWGKGLKRSYTFERPGIYTLLCKLHPEMVGYVVVVKTTYFAIADNKGYFRFENVPSGTWKLKLWNDRLKPSLQEKAHEVTLDEGNGIRIEIKP